MKVSVYVAALAAALAIPLLLVLGYLAAGSKDPVTKTVKLSPYAGLQKIRTQTSPINAQWIEVCDIYANRPEIFDGNSLPKAKDRVVIACRAVKQTPLSS